MDQRKQSGSRRRGPAQQAAGASAPKPPGTPATGSQTAGVAEQEGAPISLAQMGALLHRVTRKVEHLRARLAFERAASAVHEASARESLRRMQDLQAQVLRLEDELRATRLDADESHGQRLDMESQLQHERDQVVRLQSSLQDVGNHLRQAVATHAQDTAAWQATMERLQTLHERDIGVWRAEVDRLRAEQEQEAEAWRGEVARVLAAHEQDNATWQAEVERLRKPAPESGVLAALRRATVNRLFPGRELLMPPARADETARQSDD